MKYTIQSIDHDGFNGRDYPPAASDLGRQVTPVKMATLYTNRNLEHGELETPAEFETMAAILKDDPTAADEFIRIYTCLTDDGRVLELMDFELGLDGLDPRDGSRA